MINRLTDALPAMPQSIVAGDSLRVIRADLGATYPAADGYSATFIFVPERGGSAVTIDGEASSGGWLLYAAGSVTADWAAGNWRWSVKVESDDGRFTAENGSMRILPDPASAADTRSHARKTLDALEAVIEGRASKTDMETTLADGRQIKRISHDELVKMRKTYAGLVAAEERKRGRGGPARILVSL
jgi:hypothetical protein